MRRLAFLFLLCAVPAFAQRTIVSGTVNDSTGLAYSGASLTANLVAPVGSSGAYLNGAQIAGSVGPVQLDSTGSFLLNLPDNTLVQCANAQGQIVTCVPQTQWSFSVTLSPGVAPPLGTGPQTCKATLTISGTSQTVTSSFAACPSISKVATSVAVTPTINAIYASPACPTAATNCFTINDDVQMTTDGIYSAGSTTVGTQNTDTAFVGSGASGPEIGKIEFGVFNCPGTVSNCTYNCPQGTIQSVTDAHHVVVSIACTNTSSAALHSNNWFWGHDDASQLTASFNVILNGSGTANNQRQNLFLPCGMMFMSAPSFVIPSGIRNTNGGMTGCGGGGATVIVPLPRMNCNVAGGNGCLIGDLSQPLLNTGDNLAGWIFRDITFWGGGTDQKDAAATYSNPAVGILTNIFDALNDVFVIGWVWNNATPVIGASGTGSNWFASGSVAGGTTACQLSGTQTVTGAMFGGQCGGSFNLSATGFSLQIAGVTATDSVDTFGIYINQANTSGVTNIGPGIYRSHGDSITTCFTNQAGTTFLIGTTINQHGSGCPALKVSGGIVHLSNLTWFSSGTTYAISGGTVYDDCGVVVPQTGTAGTLSGSGTALGNCSITDIITNPAVTSRNASLSSQTLVPAIRLPYTGPMTVKLYAFDVAPAGSGCTGNTTVVWTISYTDNTGTAQTQTATETITTNGGATGGDKLATTFTFSTNGLSAITYSTTYTIGTGCTTGPSYAAQLAVT